MRTITTERRGAVLVAKIDNPPRNFFTLALTEDLHRLLDQVEAEHGVRALILTGAPEGQFITHADVREMREHGRRFPVPMSYRAARASMALVDALSRLPGARRLLPQTPMAGAYWTVRTNSFTRRLQRLDKVTIAAINGLALGAGCLVAQGFDLRLMADDDALSIGFVETAMGFGVLSGAQRLARDLGQARALDVLLNARTFTPTQAAEMGLITRTVPPDRLLDEAIATARRLAQLSPAPVRMLKRAVYEDSTKPLRRSLLAERAEFVVTATQPSVGPRMDSFLAQIAGGELSNRELMDIWDNVRGEQAS